MSEKEEDAIVDLWDRADELILVTAYGVERKFIKKYKEEDAFASLVSEELVERLNPNLPALSDWIQSVAFPIDEARATLTDPLSLTTELFYEALDKLCVAKVEAYYPQVYAAAAIAPFLRPKETEAFERFAKTVRERIDYYKEYTEACARNAGAIKRIERGYLGAVGMPMAAKGKTTYEISNAWIRRYEETNRYDKEIDETRVKFHFGINDLGARTVTFERLGDLVVTRALTPTDEARKKENVEGVWVFSRPKAIQEAAERNSTAAEFEDVVESIVNEPIYLEFRKPNGETVAINVVSDEAATR